MSVPDDLEQRIARAFAQLKAGDLAGAEAGLRAILAAQPDTVRALALLARIDLAAGRNDAARAGIARALQLEPASIPALIESAALAAREGRRDDQRGILRQLVELAPAHPGFVHDLGLLELALGDAVSARRQLERARAMSPQMAEAHFALAALDQREGRLESATAGVRQALALNPRWPEALDLQARCALDLGRPLEAIDALQRCLAIEPDRIAALDLYALAQRRAGARGNFAELVRARERIAALQPGSADAAYRVARAYSSVDLYREAADWLERAIALDPEHLAARWLRFQYPDTLVAPDAGAEAAFRQRWLAGLAHFEGLDPEQPAVQAQAAAVLGAATNFHLHYLGEPFVDEQRRYARVVEGLARAALAGAGSAPEPRKEADSPARRRIGFVSPFLRRHTMTKLMAALIEGLDRSRHEIALFHLDDAIDPTSERLRARVDLFEQGERSPLDWVRALRAQSLDALVFLDIGMHPTPQVLASFRLAPLQCALWGHPVTTGFEHIDHFLSADAMELADAQANYTERLVRLPGLGTCYAMPDTTAVPALDPSLAPEPGCVHFLFAQSAYKIRPGQDDLLARIAAALPEARLSLVPSRYPHVREAMAQRMRPAFARHGADFERQVRILPPLPESGFLALARSADVNLDSIGWSGGNTTLEITAFDVPTVTWPGTLMRSRHSAAMVATLGLDELIARDGDDYVRIALELGRDRARRERIREAIRERKHRLYDDRSVVEAFAAFLDRAIAERR